ncbi:hypothetical protein N9164_00280 [Draconibacterium sp.]|nr:hypothetical protein [Draconibacterium sp.]
MNGIISTLTHSCKNEKPIRFTLNPKGNQIDFSGFSPWCWGKKDEKPITMIIYQRRVITNFYIKLLLTALKSVQEVLRTVGKTTYNLNLLIG